MREYRYTAARSDGSIVKGRVSALSAEQAKKQIIGNKLYLLDIKETNRRKPPRMNSRETADFSRELASLLAAGVPIIKAVGIIAERQKEPLVRASMQSVIDTVAGGESLSTAMAREEPLFPGLLISMTEVGEQSGTLQRSFERMADYYERMHRIKTEVRGAMTYPVILLVITVLVIIAVFSFVFPMFIDLFGDMELPLITRIMMAVSSVFTEYYVILILSVAVVAALLFWITGLPPVKRAMAGMKFRLPIFGRLYRTLATADFARTYAALYSGGMNVLRALELSQQSLNDSYITHRFTEVIGRVKSGASLSESLAVVECFDKKLCSVIAIGESSGRLDEMLLKLSESYDYEASSAIKRILKLLEPIMIIFMALIVLAVVLSVMVPIYDIYANVL